MKNTNTNVAEFVLGWNPNAEILAQNLGLATKLVIMPGGYADRLYVSGEPEKVRLFRSFPQILRDPEGCSFSPGVNMPKWSEASAKRTQPTKSATPISDEVAAFYDSRRLTEADVDHMAEIFSEGHTFNRNSIRSSHE